MGFVSTPVSGQTLGATRDQMRNNTDLLRSGLDQDHYDVNNAFPAPAASGKHKWVDMPISPALPSTAKGEGLIYANVFSNNNQTQLFYVRDMVGITYQMTPCLCVAAAVNFSIDPSAKTCTIIGPQGTGATINVSSVTYNSMGNYTVNFANPADSANYNYAIGFQLSAPAGVMSWASTPTASSIKFGFYTLLGAAPYDPSAANITCWGG